MSIPESGRLAAHVLIDTMVSLDPDGDQAANEAAANLALVRLHEIGAVTAVIADDETVQVTLSDVVSPAIMAMIWLTSRLGRAEGVSEEEILAELRAFFDNTED